MNNLGGAVCVRNCESLDYNWIEAVCSLLGVCDKVVICDCSSEDTTRTIAESWEKSSGGQIKLVDYLWTDPRGDVGWYVNWLNYARSQLDTEWSIYLDADEVLHEDSTHEVLQAVKDKKTLICQRYNFWRDPWHLIPDGKCCSRDVIRIGPTKFFMPSDYPDERCQEAMDAAVKSTVKIMHYGFLRKREAFFKKARAVQRIWADDYDKRLEKAETYEGNWAEMPGITGWESELEEFKGTHPEIIKDWLKERGYDLS